MQSHHSDLGVHKDTLALVISFGPQFTDLFASHRLVFPVVELSKLVGEVIDLMKYFRLGALKHRVEFRRSKRFQRGSLTNAE